MPGPRSSAVPGQWACLRCRSPGNDRVAAPNQPSSPNLPSSRDHRMPSEVARLTADEREVAPSFM